MLSAVMFLRAKGKSKALPIAILGAGFSGLGMAIRLKQAGIDSFTIFEAADGIGGTWRDNTYPGCACDVPSHLYSFSFERKADWTRKYSGQAEILEYLEHCVAKYGIAPHLRLSTRIARAVWENDEWVLTSERGEIFRARVVITGTGPLSRPNVPDLPGLDRFRGAAFHSARWDHSYDFRGKRVAVVGTGASAIQFVPEIAKEVEALHLYQRTPPWVVPKPDRAFRDVEKRVLARSALYAWLYRNAVYWSRESFAMGFVVDKRLMTVMEYFAKQHIERSIEDPALRAKVTPSYTLGCKRILISNDYYPALAQGNVSLHTTNVAALDENGVIDGEGTRRDVDAIVFGTGFDATDFLAPMEVVGRDGRDVNAAWKDGAEAYFGMSVAGFPNFFMLVGPNTGLGHNSIVFMIEAQVHYVMQCIERLQREDLRYLDVRTDRQREFNARIQERMKNAVWQSGCKSWYLEQSGKNSTLWPGFTFEYWLRTRRVDRADYVAV